MDFSNLKTLIIPEGEVQEIKDNNGRILWSAEESPVPPIPIIPDKEHFNTLKWIGRKSGSQAIFNTEIPATNKTKLEISFFNDQYNNGYVLKAGARSSINNNPEFTISLNCDTNSMTCYFNKGSQTFKNIKLLNFGLNNIILDRGTIYLNNTKIYDFPDSEKNTFSTGVSIHGFHIFNDDDFLHHCKILSFKISEFNENNQEILKFYGIPGEVIKEVTIKKTTSTVTHTAKIGEIGIYNLIQDSTRDIPFYWSTATSGTDRSFIGGNEF